MPLVDLCGTNGPCETPLAVVFRSCLRRPRPRHREVSLPVSAFLFASIKALTASDFGAATSFYHDLRNKPGSVTKSVADNQLGIRFRPDVLTRPRLSRETTPSDAAV